MSQRTHLRTHKHAQDAEVKATVVGHTGMVSCVQWVGKDGACALACRGALLRLACTSGPLSAHLGALLALQPCPST